jgi:hypothetical protein
MAKTHFANVRHQHKKTHAYRVSVAIDVVDATGVEGGGSSDDAVDLVALLQEQLGEVGAVLARNAGDEGSLDTRLHAQLLSGSTLNSAHYYFTVAILGHNI